MNGPPQESPQLKAAIFYGGKDIRIEEHPISPSVVRRDGWGIDSISRRVTMVPVVLQIGMVPSGRALGARTGNLRATEEVPHGNAGHIGYEQTV